ncbi:MAG TPA: hypothetical protein VEB66_08250 [Opitutaceae bacterium]|nr:hypothetical protein [Opitutaceae bacterium]
MSGPASVFRTPGPRWGPGFLVRAERALPAPLFRFLLGLGTWVAVLVMDRRRDYSRAYLTTVLGRPAGWRDTWRHFVTFMDVSLLRLQVAAGRPHRCVLAADASPEFAALLRSGEPALFGTFHFGHADLIGFELTGGGRPVAMVRLRASDTPDIARATSGFAGLSFIFSNDPAQLLFELKAALERGQSLALQCDRLGFSARTEAFRFLGARREFPFTIYHLAVLFGRPVAFCLGVPEAPGVTRVHAAPVFRPAPGAGRAENLAAARVHFQAVLSQLETRVRQHPLLWFNFLPLNPEARAAQPAAPAP